MGQWGEGVARTRMISEGWSVLEQNYRLGRREIDLIARRGRLIAFIEVKTRSGTGFGPPEEAVTALKRREIETVAASFLSRSRLGDVDVRFDVVSILAGPGPSVRRFLHIADAWRPSSRCPPSGARVASLVPQVRRAKAHESRQDPAGSSGKCGDRRCG